MIKKEYIAKRNYLERYLVFRYQHHIQPDDMGSIINDVFLKCGIDTHLALLTTAVRCKAIDFLRTNGYVTRTGKTRKIEYNITDLDYEHNKFSTRNEDISIIDNYSMPVKIDYSEYNFPELIAKLPEREQIVIYEVFVNNKSLAAISKIIGVSNTAMSFIYGRALEKLRGMIEKKKAVPPDTKKHYGKNIQIQTKQRWNSTNASNEKKRCYSPRTKTLPKMGDDGRRYCRRSNKNRTIA